MAAHNFPLQPTSFIGRTRELAAIADLLGDPQCRLLTLVGPGGIGKTRLGIETAMLLAASYSEGVFYVPLQSLTAPELIVPTIAEVIQYQFFAGGEPVEQLLGYLANKSFLLVLDNFEHLLEGSDFIGRLLTTAPQLRLLITSRERLNLMEEWVYEVAGLRFPHDSIEAAAAELENYSAVKLFAQIARRVHPAFSLTDELSDVAQICALVEGMPLALELAASWVRALSCAQIVTEIQRGLDILQTPARNVSPRHRSMRAVIDHSWTLLSDDERQAAQRLSIFKGGFTREAADAVAGASLYVLSALVDKSWLYREGDRYDFHELLRQYAEGVLQQSEQGQRVWERYARYYADFMHQREIDIKTHRQMQALLEIERDFENIRSAWGFAVTHRQHWLLKQMMEALNFFCDMRARFAEGEELFRTASEAFADGEDSEERAVFYSLRTRHARMVMLGTLSTFATYKSQELEQAVTFFRNLDDPAETAFSLYVLGMSWACNEENNYIDFLTEALTIYESLNDPFYIAETLVWTTNVQESAVDARQRYRRALALQREMGDGNGSAWTLFHLARISFWERRYEEADAYADEALTLQRQRRDLKGLYWSMSLGSQWALRRGQFEKARSLAEEAKKISFELNIPAIQQSALAVMGLSRILIDGDYEAGERLCKEAMLLEIPPNFMVGDPLMDAAQGLMMCAYHRGDTTQAYRFYKDFIFYTDQINGEPSVYHFSAIAPLAALLLEADGRLEEAVEMLSALLHIPEIPNNPFTNWMEKTPLYIELETKLRTELRDTAYEAAWERGRHLDISEKTDQLRELQRSIGDESPEDVCNLLTERETEVLRLLADGHSNREIAAQLVLALGTVKWYLSEIYSKLGVTSRTQAIVRARELTLIS